MMSKASTNRQIMDAAWDDAHAWQAECARREAERAKPYPVITPCLLAVFAIAVFMIGSTSFGWEAW